MFRVRESGDPGAALIGGFAVAWDTLGVDGSAAIAASKVAGQAPLEVNVVLQVAAPDQNWRPTPVSADGHRLRLPSCSRLRVDLTPTADAHVLATYRSAREPKLQPLFESQVIPRGATRTVPTSFLYLDEIPDREELYLVVSTQAFSFGQLDSLLQPIRGTSPKGPLAAAPAAKELFSELKGIGVGYGSSTGENKSTVLAPDGKTAVIPILIDHIPGASRCDPKWK